MKRPQKICRREKQGFRKYLKQLRNRLIRRLWKLRGEEAPTKKVDYGYSE